MQSISKYLWYSGAWLQILIRVVAYSLRLRREPQHRPISYAPELCSYKSSSWLRSSSGVESRLRKAAERFPRNSTAQARRARAGGGRRGGRGDLPRTQRLSMPRRRLDVARQPSLGSARLGLVYSGWDPQFRLPHRKQSKQQVIFALFPRPTFSDHDPFFGGAGKVF